jgi:hypothetical protein
MLLAGSTGHPPNAGGAAGADRAAATVPISKMENVMMRINGTGRRMIVPYDQSVVMIRSFGAAGNSTQVNHQYCGSSDNWSLADFQKHREIYKFAKVWSDNK